jgi:prephenate dehydrogenase
MSNFTVTIVGTGLIGTSLGLALKQLKDPITILGHDRDLLHAKAGVKMGAFDKAEWNLVNACEQADLILLAIPLNGIRLTLEAIAPYVKQGVVISDTTPTKMPVLAWAAELLPEHAHFVGGNPVVQSAGTGHTHASADLFRKRLYCLTPAPEAPEAAVQLMIGVIGQLGAEPFFVDAVEHDGLMTAVEHLPGLLSVALVNTLSGQKAWRETRKLAGGLFEQISAGADGDPDGLAESFSAQRENLNRWLIMYIDQLKTIQGLLSQDDAAESLAQLVDHSVVERANWLTDYQQGNFRDPELALPDMEKRGLMKQLFGFGRKQK